MNQRPPRGKVSTSMPSFSGSARLLLLQPQPVAHRLPAAARHFRGSCRISRTRAASQVLRAAGAPPA